jgi:single-stranded DNA-binding protein
MAYNDKPLIGVVGNVSRPPTVRETTKGNVVNFGIAVKTGYDESQGPRWIDVSVWNEGLQAFVGQNLHKGAKVAVEGFYSTREYEGKTYEQIDAQQVGLVEWGVRTKRSFAPAAKQTEGEW